MLIAMLCGVPAVAVIEDGVPARFVKLKLIVGSAPEEAATLYGPPTTLFAVNVGAVARPLELVVTVAVAPVPGAAKAPLAPLPGAVKVTELFGTPLPLLSFTVTCNEAKAVLTAVLCDAGLVRIIVAGNPGKLVRVKLAAGAAPVVAFTEYGPPAMLLAVKVGAVAIPFAPVTAVAVPVPPVNEPEAPEAGAVNVTVAPLIRLPPLSFTVTARGAKAEFTITL